VTLAGVEFVTKLLVENNITDVASSSVLAATYPSIFSQIPTNYLSGSSLLQAQALHKLKYSDAVRKSFGLPFEEFFISCRFSLIECTADDWVWYYDVKYGNCYKFNSGYYENGTQKTLAKIGQSGFIGGLILEVFVADRDSQNTLSSQRGVHLYIGNNSVFLNPMSGIKAPVGANTNIGLEKSVHSQLSAPYSNCIEDVSSLSGYDSEYFRYILRANFSYDQDSCYSK
jgi:hypothetical protein